MKIVRGFVAAGLAAGLVLALATPALPYTREELRQYNEKTLMAQDFTLKDLDGNTHNLNRYRGMYVAIETGSST